MRQRVTDIVMDVAEVLLWAIFVLFLIMTL